MLLVLPKILDEKDVVEHPVVHLSAFYSFVVLFVFFFDIIFPILLIYFFS